MKKFSCIKEIGRVKLDFGKRRKGLVRGKFLRQKSSWKGLSYCIYLFYAYLGTLSISQATQRRYVGSEVLTAVVVKRSISWDITPCSPLKVNRLHGVISQETEIFIQRRIVV
jgi:hypothetical protein